MLKNRIYTLSLCLLLSLFFASCGSSSDDPKTAQELTIEALQGTWTLDASQSVFANTGLDGSDLTVNISETGFTLSGSITSYVSGGTYTVSEAGALADLAVALESADLELSGNPSIQINDALTQITVAFSTKQADSRVAGLGEFKFVFVKSE
ncbi:hypothetical protein [Marinoscillum furvescens]|uniref:Lipocalin-like protein n=1 Tax=Marinoscillum furvescens DSM 4134 TaxID=1122208 RepID=A0A3D9L3V2_MARFU|nr:hypothetical protein [Marinoscillum furvescens]REE00141.1 hypothetical protein C7460_10680 [Marinoscillum furvescens DSM 4134]